MDIKKLDELRLKIRNRTIFSIIVCILLCVWAIFNYMVFVILFIIASIILERCLNHKLEKEYKYLYKKYFVDSSLRKVFTDVKYIPSARLDQSILSYTGMVDLGDRYHSNDYVSGKYKDINFIGADVRIEEERETYDSDGNRSTYYVDIFKGKWLIFDFNKPFKSDIQIRQTFFPNARLNRALNFEKIDLEDVIFNKKFNVYGYNAHEVFYILTPQMIEKIKVLEEKIDGQLLFCFIDSKLYIGINNNVDSFEPRSVFFKLDENKILENINKEIELITMFVDELNLDNNLFRKVV